MTESGRKQLVLLVALTAVSASAVSLHLTLTRSAVPDLVGSWAVVDGVRALTVDAPEPDGFFNKLFFTAFLEEAEVDFSFERDGDFFLTVSWLGKQETLRSTWTVLSRDLDRNGATIRIELFAETQPNPFRVAFRPGGSATWNCGALSGVMIRKQAG